MQSKIRIEYDFETKQPVLRITRVKDSDDLRDQMLEAFIDKGKGKSNLYFTWPQYSGGDDGTILELRCEDWRDQTREERLLAIQEECKTILWSNAPADTAFVEDFFKILIERTK